MLKHVIRDWNARTAVMPGCEVGAITPPREIGAGVFKGDIIAVDME